MYDTTAKLVAAVLEQDQTVSADQRRGVFEILKSEAPLQRAVERLVSRIETAQRLSCSSRHVDHLYKEGLLRKLRLPGRSRACGVPESDIVNLIQQAASGASSGSTR